jgi:hypothetical protein
VEVLFVQTTHVLSAPTTLTLMQYALTTTDAAPVRAPPDIAATDSPHLDLAKTNAPTRLTIPTGKPPVPTLTVPLHTLATPDSAAMNLHALTMTNVPTTPTLVTLTQSVLTLSDPTHAAAIWAEKVTARPAPTLTNSASPFFVTHYTTAACIDGSYTCECNLG